MRLPALTLVIVVGAAAGAAGSACTCDPKAKPAAGSGAARAPERGTGEAVGSTKGSAEGSAEAEGGRAGSACTAETATVVSRILTDAAHPCRGRILAAYGRMVRVIGGVGGSASGTIVSTAAGRGGGLLATCRACAGATGPELLDPEPAAGAPRVVWLAGAGGPARYAAHRMFGTAEVSLAAISGDPIEAGAVPPRTLGDRDVPLEDPRGLAASRAPFVDVRPGASVLVLGFAGTGDEAQLTASIGPVLSDEEARARGVDPRSELAIAAQLLPGMAGGGVFDEAGRFVGVAIAAIGGAAAGGAGGVRAVRATAIAAALSAGLRAAPVPVRAELLPFLP